MFQFSGFPSIHYGFMYGWQAFACRVSPFRDLRIAGYLLLPEAFRSLSRLSSALSAKASTLRSCLLDLFGSLYGNGFASVRSCFAFAKPRFNWRITSSCACCSRFILFRICYLNFWSVTFVTASDVLNILLVKYFNFYMQFSRCKPKEPERSFRCRNCSDLVACAPRSEDSFSCCRSLRDLQRGDKGIRTLDPLLARQVLSQLSYTPGFRRWQASLFIYIWTQTDLCFLL